MITCPRREVSPAQLIWKPLFTKYLHMGRVWPQLRAPLACVVIAECPPRRHLSPLDVLPHELPAGLTQRALDAAERMHRAYKIEAPRVTAERVQHEWQRSVSAAHDIMRTATGDTRARTEHVLCASTDDQEPVLQTCHVCTRQHSLMTDLRTGARACVTLFETERRLAAAWRSTFLDRAHRTAWLHSHRAAWSAGLHAQLNDSEACTRDLRALIIDELRCHLNTRAPNPKQKVVQLVAASMRCPR